MKWKEVMYLVCENEFCIYWAANTCTLNAITLDRMGICSNCIYVSVEESVLKEYREKLLKKFDD